MIAAFSPCNLTGTIDAPPSKSMAHRYLIGAALSKETCTLEGIDYSQDILASIDCLKALDELDNMWMEKKIKYSFRRNEGKFQPKAFDEFIARFKNKLKK